MLSAAVATVATKATLVRHCQGPMRAHRKPSVVMLQTTMTTAQRSLHQEERNGCWSRRNRKI